MKAKEAIRIARWSMMKNLDYEELGYSDELYGHEDDVDQVWEYVYECRQIGVVAFDIKYPK